ncbi:hypothetical protein GCM10009827_062570 [Dactylosporangium maewongense]|uniref:Uncharacterized protein n=1 Tax=Dactylosporangium maewongense TaxID=634393 RepID=A0ABP4M2L4_9ACTN
MKVSTGEYDGYERIGLREHLTRLLAEYDLDEEDLGGSGRMRTLPPGVAHAGEIEYLVHRSVLRPHGAFPCAGDDEAREFCEDVADEMVRAFGISRAEAVARINRQWSEPGSPDGDVPRVWIVGNSLIYHDEPADWATGIYYGFTGRWWDSGGDRQPLPPPGS